MPGQKQPAKKVSESPPAPLERAVEAVDALPDTGAPVSSYAIFKCLGLCTLYISVSAGLIEFNKHLMHKDRFPFALALTTFHMSMTFFFCNVLYWVRPSLYPAMAKTEGHRLRLLRWFVPLGCLFAIGLVCSNKAYLYCNVAFLQFMKESNVALVFGLGSLLGLQQCTRTRLFVIAWILFGAGYAVHGEVNFLWIGFVIQLLSQFGECGKAVLGEWIMSGSSLKLDPLTYTMFMSPICLSVLLVGTVLTWQHEILVQFQEWWPVLIPNACLAFTLNIVVAVLIKECSAITFILSGLVKDMFIVLASTFFFGELVVRQQMVGFALCLGGIFFWSLMRIDPNSPLVTSLQKILGETTQAEKGELEKLLARKVVGP